MATKGEKTIWGIHAGRTGDADNLFLKHNVIALGWVEMGDVSSLAADRETFKTKLMKVRPDRKPGYYPTAGGQLFRFIHETKNGDLVIYPSKHDHRIHIGEIVGKYQYDTKPEPEYPQHRAVKWLKTFPGQGFPKGRYTRSAQLWLFFKSKTMPKNF